MGAPERLSSRPLMKGEEDVELGEMTGTVSPRKTGKHSIAKFHPLFDRLEKIRGECFQEKENKKPPTDKKYDDFTMMKKNIYQSLKEARIIIANRDSRLEKEGDAKTVDTIRLEAAARAKVRVILDEAVNLKRLQETTARKLMKKRGKKLTDAEKQVLENREQLVRLIFLHIEEVQLLLDRRIEDYEGSTAEAADRRELLKLPDELSDTRALQTVIPDLPDVDADVAFAKQDANEAKIDALLDDIAYQVGELKEMATQMKDKIEVTDKIATEISLQVEEANTDLDNLNDQLRKTLANIRSPKNFILDCCAILLIVGLGYIVYVLIKNRLAG